MPTSGRLLRRDGGVSGLPRDQTGLQPTPCLIATRGCESRASPVSSRAPVMNRLRIAAFCFPFLTATAFAAERPETSWPLLAAPPGPAKPGPPRAADADAETYAIC